MQSSAELAPLPSTLYRDRPPTLRRLYWGMTTSLTAYTPLETLLLFQSLRIYGVDPAVFSKISDLLKENPHIRAAKQFDGGRLSPDALRELYGQLVKDEVKNEARDGSPGEYDAQNGELHGNPRKRKAPTPNLPSLQDATQNVHLIPKLVEKLYARYRAQVTEEIREDEKEIERLQHELREIELGEWDDKLPEITNGKKQSPVGENEQPDSHPSPIAVLEDSAPKQSKSSARSLGLPLAVPAAQSPKIPGASPLKRPSPSITEPLTNVAGSLPAQPALQQTASTAESLSSEFPASSLAASSNPLPSQTELPGRVLSPQAVLGPGASAAVHQSPYPPSESHLPGSAAKVQPQNPPIPQPLATHTTVHPPTPGVIQPHIPGSAHVENGAKPPVPASGPTEVSRPHSPSPGRPATSSNRGQAPAQPAQPVQQQLNLITQPGPSATPHNQPITSQGALPQAAPDPISQNMFHQPPSAIAPAHQGGYMLPPFQVYDTLQASQRTAGSQPSTPTPPRTRAQRAARPPRGSLRSASGTPLPPVTPVTSQSGQLEEVLRLLSTPASHPPRSVPVALSLQTTPSSEVRWKASLPPYTGPPVPSPSASPIEEAPPLLPIPAPKSPPIAASRTRRQTKEAAGSHGEGNPIDEGSNSATAGRRQTRRTRGTSATSSAVEGSTRGRTRSQSIASHGDVMSVDTESAVTRSLKREPSPGVETAEEILPGIEAATVGRRRRGVNTPQIIPPKRKRDARDTPEIAESVEMSSTPGPQHVIAPRHFSKMCQPLMNDVTSHRHASLFSLPVKEKDAPGYKDMIRRPQDLKSIKTAINVGAKAVAAAASADTPAGPNSPGGGGGNVTLPLSIDVVPPKAIVNSSQLEKELMRMFANAVMFNSGEDGVVQDAREMFEDVQGAVSNWRSAERAADGREKPLDSDAAAEEETASLPKRRKL